MGGRRYTFGGGTPNADSKRRTNQTARSLRRWGKAKLAVLRRRRLPDSTSIVVASLGN